MSEYRKPRSVEVDPNEEPKSKPAREVPIGGRLLPRLDGRGFEEGFGEWMTMPGDVADQWASTLWRPLR